MPAGLVCTCNTILSIMGPPDTPCFCSKTSFLPCSGAPAVPAGFCGLNATCCNYMGLASLCIPDGCLQSSMCPAGLATIGP